MSLFDLANDMQELKRRIHLLETTQPMGYSSVSQGRSRFVGNESLLVQGSEKVEGWLVVTGTERVTGRLEGSGTFDWTGPWFLRGDGSIPGDVAIAGVLTVTGASNVNGPMTIRGALNVLGESTVAGTFGVTGAATFANTLRIAGTTTLASTLNVVGGQIKAGNMVFDGSNGGTIASSGTLNLLGQVVNLGGVLTQAGLFKAARVETSILEVTGSKNFKIPHPTKPDMFLRHGSTESPVSGVEYCGDLTLSAEGKATVKLPDYFEALTKPTDRVVLVTPRGFVADWGDIEDGKFTVTGKPGGRFSWLVKAVRKDEHGGHFEIEEHVFGPLRQEAA